MSEWQSWVGRTATQRDRLTPALLDRFRATIDSADSGGIAPQAIHWVLCTPEAATAALGLDGHPQRSDRPDSFFPPVPLPRRMWASSKADFIAPLRVNAEIERVSTIASVIEKTGSTGTLVFVEVKHETRAGGELAVSETQTLVYREAVSPPSPSGEGPGVGTVRPLHLPQLPTPTPPLKGRGFDEWHFHRTFTPSETLLFRFSAITFNTHRIHYDAPYAMNEEGYRGLVVHGPLMSSLLLDLAAQKFGHNTLKSFAFRAQSPAFANEPLHLVGKREGEKITLAALAGDGRTCVAAEATLPTA